MDGVLRVVVLRSVLVLVVVLVVVLVLLATVWLGQRRLSYFPDRASPRSGGQAQEVTLSTADRLRLHAWLVPATGGDGEVAVLVAPGNAGNRGDRAPLAMALAGAGLTVLLLDYRGYGGNPGQPSEVGFSRDARAGLAYLTGTAGFAPDRIIYFGESLGAAVVAELATEHPPAGLVLRSPFVDLAAVGREHYSWLPVGWMLRDRYPLAQHVAQVRAPTTVVYGSADSVIPAKQSRTVAERAAGPVRVVVVDGADHNDPALVHGVQVIGAVVDLADRINGAR
jgi:uncharacterized protein